MAITRQKKEQILKNVKDGLKKAKLVVFVNFHGLNVEAANELRKLLKNVGVGYLVAKKTIIKKAFEQFKFEGEMPNLEGEIALAVSDGDAIVQAKELQQFAKKTKKISLIGGIFENKYIGAETVVMLANIPSREVLLGKFVNIINSPLQGLVGTLQGNIRNLVSVLSQIKK